MRRRYESLDFMRGAAALIVVLFHIEISGFPQSQWLRCGYLAVDLFFLISGFVVAAAYEGRMQGGLDVVSFFCRYRLPRLYPLVFLGILFGFGAAMLGATDFNPDARILARELLMLPSGSGTDRMYPFNGVQWSLAFELFANLAHMLILRRLRLFGLLLVVIAGAIGLISTLNCFGTLETGYDSFNWWGGLARVGFSYPLGVLLFRLSEIRRLPVPKLQPVWLVLALFTAIVMPMPGGYGSGWREIKEVALVGGWFPILLCSAVQRPLSGWSVEVARWFGDLSYPLYAIQLPVIDVLHKLGPHLPRREGALLQAETAPALLVASVLVLKYYDRPVRAWLDNQFQQLRGTEGDEVRRAA